MLSNDSEWNRVVEAESTVKVKTLSDTSVLLIAELKSANFFNYYNNMANDFLEIINAMDRIFV